MPAPWRPADGIAGSATGPAVLVAGLSGRALAAAAVRSGHIPVVVDAFSDEDTRSLAAACHRVPLGPHGEFRASALGTVAAQLPGGAALVYASGFERDPDLLTRLVPTGRIVGNPPDVVEAVKQPESLFPTLARLGVDHPDTRRVPPPDGDWIAKRVGGSGGGHIRPAARVRPAADVYFQRHMPGIPLSAQVLADGAGVRILAFTTGWCDPTPHQPHRFGGLAGPVEPAPAAVAAMVRAAEALVEAFGLRGLNSLDFLIDGDSVRLLEVNPRPGASLDVLAGDPLLFSRHLAAAAGDLGGGRERPPPFTGGRAMAVAYAPDAMVIPPAFPWPDWVADRPAGGGVIPAGAPLCTVLATAGDAQAAATLARLRSGRILEALRRAIITILPVPESVHEHFLVP